VHGFILFVSILKTLLFNKLDILNQFWSDSNAVILMVAAIYIFAIIFSKSIEYQDELEETA
jgi:hypothetical protein